MQNKVMGVDDAVAKYCFSGMTVMLPGFVNVGVSGELSGLEACVAPPDFTPKQVGEVVINGKAKKIVVFKYKAKKNEKKKLGHRQPYTKVAIGEITA